MRFWDSSALLPLVAEQIASEMMNTLLQVDDEIRLLASFLSKDHPLKTADAPQLAAALRWCEGDTASASFVCLDDRLRRAALSEGFDVLPETSEYA